MKKYYYIYHRGYSNHRKEGGEIIFENCYIKHGVLRCGGRPGLDGTCMGNLIDLQTGEILLEQHGDLDKDLHPKWLFNPLLRALKVEELKQKKKR